MVLSASMTYQTTFFNQGLFGRIIDHLIIFGHELRHLFVAGSVYFPSAFSKICHGAIYAGGKTRWIKSVLVCKLMSWLHMIMVVTIS
jgi:hypothetical protein